MQNFNWVLFIPQAWEMCSQEVWKFSHHQSLLSWSFLSSWRMTWTKIHVLEGLCLYVMHLYIKGWSPLNLLPLHTIVPENVTSVADLSTVEFIICHALMCCLHEFILVLSLYLGLCFLLQLLTTFYSFRLCFTLVSGRAENAHVQDSTSLLPVFALKYTSV